MATETVSRGGSLTCRASAFGAVGRRPTAQTLEKGKWGVGLSPTTGLPFDRLRAGAAWLLPIAPGGAYYLCPSAPACRQAGSSADDPLLSVAAAYGTLRDGQATPQLMRDRALSVVSPKAGRHKSRRCKTHVSIMDVCPTICVQNTQKAIRKRSKGIRFHQKTSKTSTVSSCLS